jgi:hypothetical protein
MTVIDGRDHQLAGVCATGNSKAYTSAMADFRFMEALLRIVLCWLGAASGHIGVIYDRRRKETV